MQREFEKKVEEYSKTHKLIVPGDRVLIGLSGGADSTCLLAVLARLSKRLSVTLGAFHVNHGIRGAAAERDECFSEALCKEYGIPFFAVRESVPDRAKEWQVGTEEAGRRVRYEAAERIASEEGYTKIALAHHRNDVAETALFHLFRGSSVAGLASIPAKRDRIIRPLLSCDREEIEAYLAECGMEYCTDATNEETEYTRNKIRHKILKPAREEVNAGAVRHIAETAEECAELSDYLEKMTDTVCERVKEKDGELSFPAELLTREHAVIQKRALHRLIGRMAGSTKDITREHVESVRRLLDSQGGSRVSLPYGLVAGRDFDRIFIKRKCEEAKEPNEEVRTVSIPGEYSVGTAGESLRFCLFSYKKNTEIPKNEYTKWFDYDKIRGTLCLRTYREGDRLGMKEGSKTVKSVWVEHKVPAEQRRCRVLLADEEQVLWIPGVRCCDNYRVDEFTRTVLEVHRNGGKTDGSEC